MHDEAVGALALHRRTRPLERQREPCGLLALDHEAAAALVLAANPGATPAQVRDALVNNATPNVVTRPGSNSPNRLLFVG